MLGELSTNDLATLCKSANINKWSKNKPIKHNCLFKPTEAQKKEANYGISNVPYYRLLGKMTQDVINGSIKNALNGMVNFTNTEDTTVFLKSINVDISDATGNILYSTAIATSSQGIASGERYASGNKVLATSTIINKYNLASKAVTVKYTVTLAVGDYSKNLFSFAKISNELPKE